MKHYNKTIIVVILLLWRCYASAQEITIAGVVCDIDTKSPISNAHIYLDGTSINSITNNSGRFELKLKSAINSKLVVQHLSYETTLIDHPFEELPDTLFIREQENTISEVVVLADRFSRAQKMRAFREQFLGRSRAGRGCAIKNEDDIQLYFNMHTRKLSASSDKPIVVVNNYLGYEISFTLVDFWVQYDRDDLNSKGIQNTHFAVVSSFSDIAPDNRSIKRRRDAAYEISTNYFFKCFANNKLNDNKFVLYNSKYHQINSQNYFSITDTLSLKTISIIPGTDIADSTMNDNKSVVNTNGRAFQSNSQDIFSISDMYTERKFYGFIAVHYNYHETFSYLNFYTDSFRIDQYGNIDEIDKIVFLGLMGDNRAGDMLPVEYER